jgi:hypothetical protein
MTENESFDPVRSAAIRRMLVRTAAQTPRRRRGRIALISTLAILGALLAGGSTAYALGVRPFQIVAAPPVVTPSATPTPTPTAPPTKAPPVHFAAPTNPVAVSCAQLNIHWALELALHKVTPEKVSLDNSPEGAALQEVGHEYCLWKGDQHNQVTVEVSTNVAAARVAIAANHKAHQGSLHVGDVSSQDCTGTVCVYSIDTGDYWIIISNYEGDSLVNAQSIKQYAKAATTLLRKQPPVAKPWVSPSTSWSGTTCPDLKTATPMSVIEHSPKLSGVRTLKYPEPMRPGSSYLLSCYWEQTGNAPEGQVVDVNLTVARGAAWGYDVAKKGGHTAIVTGADAAVTHCGMGEVAEYCSLYILSDNSFIGLDLGSTFASPADQKAKLIHAAEAILAAHKQGS